MIYIKNLFYLLFPLVLGTIIGITTNNFIDYSILNKPPLSPPSIIFPIVWTIIYILLGLSYLLFKNNIKDTLKEELIYYIQLFVNLSWTIIFFVFKLRLFSIFYTILLLTLVLYLFYLFYQKYKISAYFIYIMASICNISYYWCIYFKLKKHDKELHINCNFIIFFIIILILTVTIHFHYQFQYIEHLYSNRILDATHYR